MNKKTDLLITETLKSRVRELIEQVIESDTKRIEDVISARVEEFLRSPKLDEIVSETIKDMVVDSLDFSELIEEKIMKEVENNLVVSFKRQTR